MSACWKRVNGEWSWRKRAVSAEAPPRGRQFARPPVYFSNTDMLVHWLTCGHTLSHEARQSDGEEAGQIKKANGVTDIRINCFEGGDVTPIPAVPEQESPLTSSFHKARGHLSPHIGERGDPPLQLSLFETHLFVASSTTQNMSSSFTFHLLLPHVNRERLRLTLIMTSAVEKGWMSDYQIDWEHLIALTEQNPDRPKLPVIST